MQERKPHLKFSTIFTILIIFFGWILLAPTNIGGSTSYIILVGNSMEPLFHQGDLVLTRQQDRYNIGDIVAYRHPEIGVVFHRIIEFREDSFILMGDNNAWVDSYKATNNDLIGKYWFRIKNAGSFIKYFRKPVVFTITIVAFFITFVMNFLENKKINTTNLVKKQNAKKKNGVQKEVMMNKDIADKISYLILFAVFLLGLTIYAFINPVKIISPNNIEYKQIGMIEYAAQASGNVFSNDLLGTGDPIFRALTDTISLNFTYTLNNDAINNINGTFRLIAEISERNGWKREVEIFPETAFSGNAFKVESALDLTKFDEIVENFENQTEIVNNQYTLSIVPEITLNGYIYNTFLQENFNPSINFSYDTQKVVPIIENEENGSAFIREKIGTVSVFQENLNMFSFLGISVSYLFLRIISLLCLLASTAYIIYTINSQKIEKQKELE